MPGALGSSPPADPAGQRLRQRARAVPARRVDDDARRLVDDEQVLVLVGDRERRVGAVGAGRRRLAARRPRPARRRRARGAWRAAAPSTVTWPPSISRCARRARAGVRGEEDVEPLAGRLGRDRQLTRHRRRGRRRSSPPARALEHRSARSPRT